MKAAWIRIFAMRALARCRECILGREHSSVVEGLRSLGDAAREASMPAVAEQALCRALAIEETQRPHRFQSFAVTLGKLGEIYLTPKRAVDAKSLFERAVQMQGTEWGSGSTDMAWLLDGLAQAHRLLHEDIKAEPLLRHALDLREAKLGPDHQEVLDNLTRLGKLLSDLGRYEQAEPLFMRVVETQERLNGSNHLALAAALDNLALLHDQKGEFGRSEKIYRRVVAIESAVLKRPGQATFNIEGHRPADPVESA